MSKTAAFFLLLLLGACQSSDQQRAGTSPEPEHLLLEIADERRFVHVDEVADRIINEDPSLMLVDVRSAEEYSKFTLPGALNIPLSSFLDDDQCEKLDCEKYAIVFFSDGDVHAEQAWLLSRRRGCSNIYIMKGGLNEWTAIIMQPQEPPQTASAEEFERYSFRKAACKYFIGVSKPFTPEPYVQTVQAPAPKKTVTVKPKKKEEEEEEGC